MTAQYKDHIHTPTGHIESAKVTAAASAKPKERIPKSCAKFEAILFTRNSLKYAFIMCSHKEEKENEEEEEKKGSTRDPIGRRW